MDDLITEAQVTTIRSNGFVSFAQALRPAMCKDVIPRSPKESRYLAFDFDPRQPSAQASAFCLSLESRVATYT